MRISLIFLSLILLLGFSGCTHSGLYPVTIQITDKGEPVDAVNITFVGDDGAYAMGLTDAQGISQMYTFVLNDGVKPGSYRIRLSKYPAVPMPTGPNDPAGDAFVPSLPAPVPLVPRKFLDIETSGLSAVVEKKTPTLVFDIGE